MITPDHKNKIVFTQSKEINIKGVTVKAILRTYKEPIRKSDNLELYSRVEVFNGDIPIGGTSFEHIKTKRLAEELFNNIEKKPEAFINMKLI